MEKISPFGTKILNNGFKLNEGPYFTKDIYLWMPPDRFGNRIIEPSSLPSVGSKVCLESDPIRAYYFTRMVGDNDSIKEMMKKIALSH